MAFLSKEGVARLWAHIALKIDNKVDAVEGKGLSTEDFTAEEKEKLSKIGVNGNPIISYGPTDLEAGVSELAEGEVYIYYE